MKNIYKKDLQNEIPEENPYPQIAFVFGLFVSFWALMVAFCG
jgi:hypothetical protein